MRHDDHERDQRMRRVSGPAASRVSCLMVTADRLRLARRAVRCFARQTWPERELVIVDDGDRDYGPMLAELPSDPPIRYEKVERREGRTLGELRNLALELADGEFLVQWDDDDWHHPRRIERQMEALESSGAGAVVLKSTLMHVDTPRLRDRPFRSELRSGIPGTVLHARSDVRYPGLARREDSVYRDRLQERVGLAIPEEPHAHLFVRCYHGDNTWELRHFSERLYRTPRDAFHYLLARFVRGDLFSHPRFRLTAREREAFELYLRNSEELGLLGD